MTNLRQDTRTVFVITNRLSNKPKPPLQNLSTDGKGKLLESAEETANVWYKFLEVRFRVTPAEEARPEMAKIPSFRAEDSALTRQEFDDAVRRMSNDKASGPDGIPAEVIKHCPEVREALFQITVMMWNAEVIPDGLAGCD